MTLQHILNKTVSRIQDIKSLEYFLKLENFAESYTGGTPEEQAMVAGEIEACFDPNYDERNRAIANIKGWLKSKKYRDISIRDLREHARSAGIRGYSRYSKDQLLSALKKRTNGQGQFDHGNLGFDFRHSDPATGDRDFSLDDCVQEGKA